MTKIEIVAAFRRELPEVATMFDDEPDPPESEDERVRALCQRLTIVVLKRRELDDEAARIYAELRSLGAAD